MISVAMLIRHWDAIKRLKLLKIARKCFRVSWKYPPVKPVLGIVLTWSLIIIVLQIIITLTNKRLTASQYSKAQGKIDFSTQRGITLLYTYNIFNVQPVETDIKQHPKVIWIEQEIHKHASQTQRTLEMQLVRTLHELKNCTQKALSLILNSLSSWLKWKNYCTFHAGSNNSCSTNLKNICMESYFVIKTSPQVTLRDLNPKIAMPELRILHLVPTESSLKESSISYMGKLRQLINLPFTEIAGIEDFCSLIKTDINYVEANLSTNLDDNYMLLNVENYKSNTKWFMMELLNFLDLYPSGYHLKQMQNTLTQQHPASKTFQPITNLLQVNLDGLEALRKLKTLWHC